MLDNYKKKLSTSLIITAMLSVSTLSYAEIASSRLKTVELEDGSKIKIRQWGDEFSHGWQTETGYSIVKDNKTGIWYYAKSDKNGQVVQSSYRLVESILATQPSGKISGSIQNKVASSTTAK